jgi:hypothetical protein
MTDDTTIPIGHMPSGHLVVGYIAHLKVMDDNGRLYFATRVDGLNDMEMYGMAANMADSFGEVLAASKETLEDQ